MSDSDEYEVEYVEVEDGEDVDGDYEVEYVEVEEDEDEEGEEQGEGEDYNQFEFEGEESSDDEEVEIENEYYNAKAYAKDNPSKAIDGFKSVLKMENEPGQWGFKALKQMIKLLLNLERYDEMKKRYEQLLEHTKSRSIVRNDTEKAINKFLNLTRSAGRDDLVEHIYDTTLNYLKENKNERLWFSTKMNQGQLAFEQRNFSKLNNILAELKASCQAEDGATDSNKGGQLLEIYALEIQMYTEQKDNKKLRQLYDLSMDLKQNALLNPRTTGIIRECGGKMNMREKNWDKAATDFFEAFKSYDEAGVERRIDCLKYLVLANMLSNSDINPFDANEAKPYKSHNDIVAMTDLISAFQKRDIKSFEKILKDNKKSILEDNFISNYIQDLLKTIRTEFLRHFLRPYRTIRLSYLAKELNINVSEVENLCVDLILDKKIHGRIDQIQQLLVLTDKTSGTGRFHAINRWAKNLENTQRAVLTKVG
eukprot:gb/GECH01012951.1/.p1 GENE.gb/GECH01012951.1/~~gb/GECH01012951.1/.p1  ORF type:complete len:480 (+),score=142.08 gb/GECH01012951.1/:1-1440(+)